MKLSPITIALNNNQNYKKENKIINQKAYLTQPKILSNVYPKTYFLLNFEARVDKDLNSFIQRNEQNLPHTLKAYVDNLSEEEKISKNPLQAQREAFEYLAICDSVEDVKDAYPQEPLFKNLKQLEDINSKRGLLYDIRLMQDDIAESGENLLINGDNNLSIYLLKKIFLEGKTISEINESLHNDINPILQKDDKNYILSSTLNALGIELPSVPYLNSLRYTKDGYSDEIGKRLSQRWSEKTEEQKAIARASHSNRTFSDEDKKRMSELSKARWSKMTPEQRVEQILKMQEARDENQSLAMICAWNECMDIRNAMSDYLSKNNFHSPQSAIYSSSSLGKSLGLAMSNFWIANPQYAREFGDAVIEAYKEIKRADSFGDLNKYKEDALSKRDEIKAELKQIRKSNKAKNVKTNQAFKVQNDKKEDKLIGIERYKKELHFVPKRILDEQVELLKQFSNKEIDFFTDYCIGKDLDETSKSIAMKVCETVAPSNSKGMQCFIVSSINEFEKCLTPIMNFKNGKKYQPHFPINLNFRFSDITKAMHKIEKDGYEKFDLLSNSTESNGLALNSFADDVVIKQIIKTNSNILDLPLIKSYKYKLNKAPNIKNINREFEEIIKFKAPEKLVRTVASNLCSPDASDKLKQDVYSVLSYRHDNIYVLGNEKTSISANFKVLLAFFEANSKENVVCPSFDKIFSAFGNDFVEFFHK